MSSPKPKPRYLTKSIFKTALECPTKLSYLKKPEFPNTKQDNLFLKALAEGGFQVGELAKVYYPGGVQVETLNSDDAVTQTEELLTRSEVIIFEGAFRFKNCLIRADIVIKTGNCIDLIEVKAKSINGDDPSEFWTKKKDALISDWKPYLLDVTFQKWVVAQGHPDYVVTPFLMLVDKERLATVDGLNQRFFITSRPTDSNLVVQMAPGTTKATVGEPIMSKIDVSEEANYLLAQQYNEMTFDRYIEFLANHYTNDTRIAPQLQRECKNCEYRVAPEKLGPGQKSGFEACWEEAAQVKRSDLERGMSLDIWALHYAKKDALIESRKFFLDEVSHDDIAPKKQDSEKETDFPGGMTGLERRWVQVTKGKEHDKLAYVRTDELGNYLSGLSYPFHLIDFETVRGAIPFHKNRRPYEQIAFQFSHHVLSEDGKVEHKNQFLSYERGAFPNFEFVRALKKALGEESGTIFRYAEHENTVLREIRAQLEQSGERDSKELCEWIDHITRWKVDKRVVQGPRNMVDMKKIIESYYYHPATNGSNSIKAVLPATLSESKFLKTKYSQPIYGAVSGIRSLNFKNYAWIVTGKDGKVKDPYKSLEPVFTDIEMEALERDFNPLYESEECIAEGGAAMTAFARMQFTQMAEEERLRVKNALLKYCELDTLAMVMIFEYWINDILQAGRVGKAA